MPESSVDHLTDQDREALYLRTLAYYHQAEAAEHYAHSVEELRNSEVEEAVRALVARVLRDFPQAPRILDAGCGSGYWSEELRKAGGLVSGCDESPAFVERNRQKYPGIEFTQGNLLNLPYLSGSFSGAFHSSSWVHFPAVEYAQQAAIEASRVLMLGGWIFHRVKERKSGGPQFAVSVDQRTQAPRLFQYYERDQISELLKGAGFTVVEQNLSLDVRDAGQRFINTLARKTA